MNKLLSKTRATRLRQILTLALAVFSTSSQAVMLNPDGQGEVLLFPYYSVNAGQQSFISLVNQSNAGKAVKLHFRESQNGRATLSLNVYMSEFDVWTAALIAIPGQDGAALITFDNTCTLPAIKTNSALPQLANGVRYLPLSTADFTGARADGGTSESSRTREGYIEAIEMGALQENSESDRAATHVGGVPRDCPSLIQAWRGNGYWVMDSNKDLRPPSGQLSGSVSVITLTEGTVFNVDPVAINGFSIIAQHTDPAASLPDLSSAITDPDREQVESTILSGGIIYRNYWPQQNAIDAVSAVLMHDQIRSEFNIDPALAARSEWIITLPTRRHYVDGALTDNRAIPPFTQAANPDRPSACEQAPIQVFDRNGLRSRSVENGDSQDSACFCAVVQRWSVNTSINPSSASPSCLPNPLSTRTDDDDAFATGYFNLSLDRHLGRATVDAENFHGLPAIGFMRTSYESNDPETGQKRIYSSTAPQSGSVRCQLGKTECPGQ